MTAPRTTNRMAFPLIAATATVFAAWICGVMAQDDLPELAESEPPGIEGPRLAPPISEGGEAAWVDPVGPQAPLFLPAPGVAERKILSALDEKTTLEFIDTPLSDCVQFIGQQSGIPVILDVRSLDEVGIPNDEPISVSLSGVSLRSALKITFSDLDITWVIEDEALKLTTTDAAATKEMTRVYPVADLVSPDEASWSELTEAIQTGVLKGHWQSEDGTGGTVAIVQCACYSANSSRSRSDCRSACQFA